MTATVLENDTDTEWFFELSESLDIICESQYGCDKPSKWIMRMKCCAFTFTLCDPCFQDTLEWMKTVGSKRSFHCIHCHTNYNPGDDPYMEPEKL